MFRVTASGYFLARIMHWREEGTPLRACLTRDGDITLADPAPSGNAAPGPLITIISHAREQTATQDQAPAGDK